MLLFAAFAFGLNCLLTNHAGNLGKGIVFGVGKKRPNIHIEDIDDLYVDLLSCARDLVVVTVWNVGYENHRVREIAEIIRQIVDKEGVEITTIPTDGHRSYHISSDRIKWDPGFAPKRTIEDAVQDLVNAFYQGEIRNSMENLDYYNVESGYYQLELRSELGSN